MTSMPPNDRDTDRAIDATFNAWERAHGRKAKRSPPPEGDEVWISADGRRTKVGDMDEDHVRNVLRMLLRQVRRRKELKRALVELQKHLDEIDHEDRKWGRD